MFYKFRKVFKWYIGVFKDMRMKSDSRYYSKIFGICYGLVREVCLIKELRKFYNI